MNEIIVGTVATLVLAALVAFLSYVGHLLAKQMKAEGASFFWKLVLGVVATILFFLLMYIFGSFLI